MSIAKENFNEKLLKQFGRSVKTKRANYVEVLLSNIRYTELRMEVVFGSLFKPVLLFSLLKFLIVGEESYPIPQR